MPRVAKPTRIKELEGNPGKRKLNKAEPKPLGAPSMPPIMSPVAKKVWARLAVSMPPGVFTDCDADVLSVYCEAVAQHRQLTSAIMEGQLVTTGSTGQEVVNPLIKTRNDTARLIIQCGVRLGLDPIARQQINDLDAADKDDDEGFSQFL